MSISMSFTFIICKYKEIFESLRVRTHYLFNQNSLDETITAGGQKVESKEGTTTTGLCTPGIEIERRRIFDNDLRFLRASANKLLKNESQNKRYRGTRWSVD